MTLMDLMARSFATTVTFLKKTQDRITNAQAAASANTYKADNLASDVVGFWSDGMDAVAGLLQVVPAGLPTFFFNFTAVQAAGGLGAEKQLPVDPPAGMPTNPLKTSLQKLGGGGNKKIEATYQLLANDILDVKLANLGVDKPDAGLYGGVVHLGANPVALVLAQVD